MKLRLDIIYIIPLLITQNKKNKNKVKMNKIKMHSSLAFEI